MKARSKKKNPRDLNQLAAAIVGEATDESRPKAEPEAHDDGKDPAAVSLGRKGGLARAKKLSGAQKADIARKAATKRWNNAKKRRNNAKTDT